jgi:hypothetical protein
MESQVSNARPFDELRAGSGVPDYHSSQKEGLNGRRSVSYLQSTLLSCAAAICHLPLRFNQVSVQTWHTFASGCALSLPMECSLP